MAGKESRNRAGRQSFHHDTLHHAGPKSTRRDPFPLGACDVDETSGGILVELER